MAEKKKPQQYPIRLGMSGSGKVKTLPARPKGAAARAGKIAGDLARRTIANNPLNRVLAPGVAFGSKVASAVANVLPSMAEGAFGLPEDTIGRTPAGLNPLTAFLQQSGGELPPENPAAPVAVTGRGAAPPVADQVYNNPADPWAQARQSEADIANRALQSEYLTPELYNMLAGHTAGTPKPRTTKDLVGAEMAGIARERFVAAKRRADAAGEPLDPNATEDLLRSLGVVIGADPFAQFAAQFAAPRE